MMKRKCFKRVLQYLDLIVFKNQSKQSRSYKTNNTAKES